MSLVTGPIDLLVTYPDGSVHKMKIVDDAITGMKVLLKQAWAVSHFPLEDGGVEDSRAGQIRPGKAPVLVDLHANIQAKAASDYPEILAYATDTDRWWLSWDDGGYAWVEVLDPYPTGQIIYLDVTSTSTDGGSGGGAGSDIKQGVPGHNITGWSATPEIVIPDQSLWSWEIEVWARIQWEVEGNDARVVKAVLENNVNGGAYIELDTNVGSPDARDLDSFDSIDLFGRIYSGSIPNDSTIGFQIDIEANGNNCKLGGSVMGATLRHKIIAKATRVG